jgi:N utilization substance protein B
LPILTLWKDPEDEIEFAKTLFRKTLSQATEHNTLIKDHTENWDIDRIAMMDMILMRMALSEARECKQIPLKVTLNEYIEISKYYSTPKSSNFINGVLDKLFTQLKEDGTIAKVGRGLIQ